MARSYAKVSVKGGVRLHSTKVSLPRDNPLGKVRKRRGFVAASSPASTKKNYAKSAPAADPSLFGVSFGNTGLTGES